jgi:release factor glutamine methyltransferase
MIVSNPPYIPTEDWAGLSREVKSEPRLAVDGGLGGLAVIDAILEQAPSYLKRGGWLLLEIGQGQAGRIAGSWTRRRAYESLAFAKDLNGIERILIARRHG